MQKFCLHCKENLINNISSQQFLHTDIFKVGTCVPLKRPPFKSTKYRLVYDPKYRFRRNDAHTPLFEIPFQNPNPKQPGE